ncbi:scavenger receptor class B member 1-like [Drosophila sulfurigaster albostrigata]|uniref:scavenger receptor class B member 1-like n=1 Tax=Drosophila sulfurigaster albostrigata TaxID=89887 RepID=UPI002D21BA3E|nr:scavenger receptor class B member 1-like [Drosophila sulfurigaster albostrigata]
MKHGMKNFFRIQTFKGERLISRFDWTSVSDDCAINVQGAFDNSLFPPFITKNSSLSIMAFQLCSVIPFQYKREEIHHGLHGYRYVIMPPKETKCFSKAYGETLPKDMFDISNCVRMPWLEEVPTAFSAPHFYGSSYNWSEHFEGLNPNAEEHEAFILLEPTTGVKINERIRFQSNTILPDLRSMYNGPQRLSNKIVPNFWYEFEMDELPFNVRFIIFINAYAMPVLQPIMMIVQLLGAIWSLNMLLRIHRQRRYLPENAFNTIETNLLLPPKNSNLIVSQSCYEQSLSPPIFVIE